MTTGVILTTLSSTSSFDQGRMILKLNDVFNSESKTFQLVTIDQSLLQKQKIHEEEELKNSNNNDNSIGNNISMNQNLNNSNIELCNKNSELNDGLKSKNSELSNRDKDSDLSDGLNEIHKNSCLTSLIILIFFCCCFIPKIF